MRFLLLAALVACGGRPLQPQVIDQAPRGVPAIDEDGPRRYVSEVKDGLVEVAPSGARQPVASPPIHWCMIDDKARVVWFTTSHALIVFDLDDRQLVPVVLDRQLDRMTIAIDHGNEQHALGELTLVIEVSDTPALRAQLALDASPELRALRDRAARDLRLEDPAYVASLYARGAASPYRMRACEE
jgi:hypothetical protein